MRDCALSLGDASNGLPFLLLNHFFAKLQFCKCRVFWLTKPDPNRTWDCAFIFLVFLDAIFEIHLDVSLRKGIRCLEIWESLAQCLFISLVWFDRLPNETPLFIIFSVTKITSLIPPFAGRIELAFFIDQKSLIVPQPSMKHRKQSRNCNSAHCSENKDPLQNRD